MRGRKLSMHLVLCIVFLLFNVIAFFVPTSKTPTFWITYAFTIVAFVLQPLIWRFGLGQNNTATSKFLGVSIICVGVVYLIFQLVVFAFFMLFFALSPWITIIVCTVVLSVALVCFVAGKEGVKRVDQTEEKVRIKRFFIQSLQTDIELLLKIETDPQIKKALEELAFSVRFSDPMSHELLGDIESRISEKVKALKTATDKQGIIAEIETLLVERNMKCKILK